MRSIVVSIICVMLCSCSSTKIVRPADNVAVAHRGAWKALDLPENSIASLKQAVKMKFRGSEFDVRMTVDDSLVITHDPEYANLIIEEATYQELSKVPLKNGEQLPTLRNYITAGMENNTATTLICEIKPSKSKQRSLVIAEKVLQLVAELKAQGNVAYISFSYSVLQRLEELNPMVHTQYLDGSKSPEQLKEDGIDGADYYFTVFQEHPEWIGSAKKNSIALNAWTVNKAEDIDWLLAEGFEYITTNEPELVLDRAQLKSKK